MSTYAKESHFWVANFFLNSVFNSTFKPPLNAYAYNFVRRAQYAFSEHSLARSSTLEYVAKSIPSAPKYADALFHWECFLSQAWHAYALLVKALQAKAFDKNDGSVEQRLNALYNQMKHVESRIENGQMPPGATVPVWLENDGLHSIDCSLTYEESGAVLKDLAKYADALSNPSSAAATLGGA